MAEVKNAFIKSKMNQDLDGRLLPSGEYREGVNIQVSKSEGPDVGALENVRGNQLIADFRSLTNNSNIDVIGQYTDVTNNIIYVFLTDYTDTSSIKSTYYAGAKNYIFSYNVSTGDAIQLIGETSTNKSNWLNFSKTNPIYAINVLENLLFWTDNRNQPRKLNIAQATFTAVETTVSGIRVLQSNYYTTEEQISVAKLYPYECINLYRLNVATGKSNSVLTGTVISLLTSTIIGDIQPGAIVSSTNITASPVATVVSVSAPSGNPFVTAITISSSKTWGTGGISDVITFTPATSTYSTSMLDVVSKFLPNGGLGSANSVSVSGGSTTIDILTSSIEGKIIQGAIVSSSEIFTSPTVTATPTIVGNFTRVVVSANITWFNEQIITFNANPNYDASYPGDPDYLRNKFVRFSYRYKFADGEYSPFAPFTQAAFIPQQDGYFLEGDENDTFRSTVVDFMQNKVNKVILNIPLPSNNIYTDYKIQEIDILYKESDSLAVTVLDTILQSSLPSNANFIDYNYESRKPFKTLPESQLIRVYDKVPVKAFGQEISGNRVIYSNFQDKHTPPNQLDYNVGAFNKYSFDINSNDTLSFTSINEYPMHTLKQNRNYQVGVVLSDKFGRSSTVILSSVNPGDILDTGGVGSFGGATYFHPYKSTLDINTELDKISTWPGDSLKVLFNSVIPSAEPRIDLPGYPGLYNGNIEQQPAVDGTGGYNPLGWYSYKIVVKQFEQEYYNVYLPGILNGYPTAVTGTDPDPQGSTAFITLINDNINKVPRDLTEVGPEQKQYRSSIQLYGRVTPDAAGPPTFNKQFYPGTASNTVNTIGEQDFVLGNNSTPLVDYTDVYQTISNPYLGRITQTPGNAIGSLPAASYTFFLGVYETAPIESRINIFWETSTTGLISDLNTAIDQGVQSVVGVYEGDYYGKESDAPGTYVAGPFAPQLSNSVANPPVLTSSDLTLSSITAGLDTVIPLTGSNARFVLEKFAAGTNLNGNVFNGVTWSAGPLTYDSYALKTAPNQYFFYGDQDAIVAGQMEFEFVYNVEGYSFKPIVEGTLQNVPPVITNCPAGGLKTPEKQPGELVIAMTGTNGMPAGSDDNLRNLTWSLDPNSSDLNSFRISNDSADFGSIYAKTLISGPLLLTAVLTDAGGLQTSCNLSPTFGELPINAGFGEGTNNSVISSARDTGSATIVWTSNITNALPAEDNTTFNTAPFSSIRFGVDDLPVSKSTKTENIITPDYGSFSNTVENALGVTDQSLGGLTAGTGFISINVTLSQSANDAFYSSSAPRWYNSFFAMPIQLQYRATSGGTWVDAIDIEGQNCSFGGTNQNLYENYPGNNIVQNTDAPGAGFIKNYYRGDEVKNFTQYLLSKDPSLGSTATDTLQGDLSLKRTQNSDELVVNARKNFAIGQSQSYNNISNKFGDYRLIIRYPYAAVFPQGYSDYIVLGYYKSTGAAVFPTGVWAEGGASGLIAVKAQWGDFYYPSQLNSFVNFGGEIPSSYEYTITAVGQNTKLLAANYPSLGTNLYAREWDMKYVSQFYTDSELQNKWAPPNWSESAAWYAYKPVSENTVNARFGTQNASAEPNTPDNNIQREWTAYFEDDGKKAIGTAVPVYPNFQLIV